MIIIVKQPGSNPGTFTPMTMDGYIKIQRRLFDHWIWETDKPVSEGRAWIEMLRRAVFSAKVQYVKGRQIALERGQLIASHRKLAEWCNWDKNRADRFLRKLRRSGMIEATSEAGVTIVTICNYDKYNPVIENFEAVNGARVGQEWGSTGAAPGRERDKNNKGIKEKGNKEIKEERAENVPLHIHAADAVIEYLNENQDHLKMIVHAAAFRGDWQEIVRELYCRKSDMPAVLKKAIREPSSHLGWVQSDMQMQKSRKNEPGPKKAFVANPNGLRAQYGLEDTP